MRGEPFSVETGSDNILSKLGKSNVVVLFENWVVVLGGAMEKEDLGRWR